VKIAGIITARSNSKRLPGKNLRDFHGRPLLAHTCTAARESGVFDEVWINTDAPEIADVASKYDVRCLELRPAALARDDIPSQPVVAWQLNALRRAGFDYDLFYLLQPTSPLRTADDIRAALALYEENAPCTVVGATPVAPANWLGRATRDGCFEKLAGSDVIYRLNGAIYVHQVADYCAGKAPRKTVVYPMPASRSVDIDTEEDFQLAEAYHAQVVVR
jgi:CMP-N-acetylneuraminic acid synthetase